MNPVDSLAIGTPLFAGLFLLCRFFRRFPACRTLLHVREKGIAVHRMAHAKLVEQHAFPIAGGRLVSSLRGWVAGELLWAATVAVSIAFCPTLPEILAAAIFGLGLGLSVVFLSVREQARKQLENVRSALPVAAFLLSLLLEAGMGSHSALQEVAGSIPRGPLAEELEEISRSRMLGISREEALERSRKRVPLDDYHIFLNLVRQGERLGVGLSRGLLEHSSKMLEGEGHRAEATAQKAAVKLLFPLVAFIFPAVALVIFSPILLHVWEAWGN